MDDTQLRQLLQKYRLGTADQQERTLLESWYLNHAAKTVQDINLDDLLASNQRITAQLKKNTGIDLNPDGGTKKKLWPAISIAASILAVLSFGAYLFKPFQRNPEHSMAVQYDVPAGTDKATLTLGNGKQVILTGAASGAIASQGNTTIINTHSGTLLYKANRKTSDLAATANTVTTPRGGQYQVILPDGTHVWLNAASSITFPTAFAGAERKVTLNGEAYFEVAHNKNMPFRVASGRQTVEVLGTHFNVMAYNDENEIRTTLLEGRVKILKATQSKILRPGEQAVVSDQILIQQADVESATAWKNGRTYFKDADIPIIMRSLSRWYNVDIEYQGTIPKRLFTGGISRQANLSTLVRVLQESDIHAAIQGRKLIIKP